MAQNKLKIVWSKTAKAELKSIYNYWFYKRKARQGAKNIRADILKASRKITFTNQFQQDEIEPTYRRIIVRDYKLLYKEISGKIVILKIFGTKQKPDK